jgi:uncharacterized membrane protein
MPNFSSKIRDFSNKYSVLVLSIAMVLYTLLFSLLSLKKYYNFSYNAYDLAIFNQVFFNTLHGDWFAGTVNQNIYLADHLAPIIFLLLPFYWIKQSPETLLVLQSAILALSAWPIYLIAKNIIKEKFIALIVSLMWLLNPFIHTANAFEFHLLPIAVLLVFWTFYFYQKKSFKLFVLFFVLALFTREDISLILLAFAWLAVLGRRDIKWKLFSFILPIVYFVAALKVVSYFSVAGSYKFFAYYGWLGGESPGGILISWLTHPLQFIFHVLHINNFASIAVLMLPVLFLPFLKSRYLSLACIPFLQILLSSGGFNFMAYSAHYTLLFMPGIFIALIYGLKRINRQEKFPGSKHIYQNIGFASIVFVITVVYFSIFMSPAKDIIKKQYPQTLTTARQEFFAQVPSQARLVAESTFIAQASSRSTLYTLTGAYFGCGQFCSFEFVMPPVDYILVDNSQFIVTMLEREQAHFLEYKRDGITTNWRTILEDYSLVKVWNNLTLWQNKQNTDQESIKLFEGIKKSGDFSSEDFLVSSDFSGGVLQLSLQKKHTEDNIYLVRFYGKNYDFDMPLDYGLLSEKEWPEDEVVSFYYYLSADIKSYQIFSYQGVNAMSLTKDVWPKLELSEETEIMDLLGDR